jgi:hypothetical protein
MLFLRKLKISSKKHQKQCIVTWPPFGTSNTNLSIATNGLVEELRSHVSTKSQKLALGGDKFTYRSGVLHSDDAEAWKSFSRAVGNAKSSVPQERPARVSKQ